MRLLSLISAPALAALVGAQSAPGFPITVEENLVVTYSDASTDVSPPGVLLPRAGKRAPGRSPKTRVLISPQMYSMLPQPTVQVAAGSMCSS
jgi:hypothetical protein